MSISSNSGTIRAWKGTISPAAMRKKSGRRPRKATRENANAAIEASSTVRAVTTTDTSAELKYQRKMSPLSSTLP